MFEEKYSYLFDLRWSPFLNYLTFILVPSFAFFNLIYKNISFKFQCDINHEEVILENYNEIFNTEERPEKIHLSDLTNNIFYITEKSLKQRKHRNETCSEVFTCHSKSATHSVPSTVRSSVSSNFGSQTITPKSTNSHKNTIFSEEESTSPRKIFKSISQHKSDPITLANENVQIQNRKRYMPYQ